jgi:hypothetical protein
MVVVFGGGEGKIWLFIKLHPYSFQKLNLFELSSYVCSMRENIPHLLSGDL